jgi:AraC-like DNA-binding protein
VLKISLEPAPAGEIRGADQPAWQLALLREGAYVELSAGLRKEMAPGNVRLSPPGYRHHLLIDGAGAVCLTVQADGPFWSAIFARALHASTAPTFAPERLNQMPAIAEPADIGVLLAQLRGVAGPDPAMEEAKRALDANEPISLTRLAANAGLPRGRFAARFRNVTGFQPSEYRLARRAVEARRRLTTTQVPLRDIAADVGFADQSHMTNALRAVFGVTPKRVRTAA